MEETRKKFGWTEKGIIGFVYCPMGAVFLLLGLLLYRFLPEENEARRVFLCCFGGLGAVFLVIGAVLLGLDLRRRARWRRAYEGGVCVRGTIAGFAGNTRVNVNGRSPLRAECHYTDPDTGTLHIYYSRYLYFHPEGLTGAEVPLYLDREDIGNGFVDIDAVLPKVVFHKA